MGEFGNTPIREFENSHSGQPLIIVSPENHLLDAAVGKGELHSATKVIKIQVKVLAPGSAREDIVGKSALLSRLIWSDDHAECSAICIHFR